MELGGDPGPPQFGKKVHSFIFWGRVHKKIKVWTLSKPGAPPLPPPIESMDSYFFCIAIFKIILFFLKLCFFNEFSKLWHGTIVF